MKAIRVPLDSRYGARYSGVAMVLHWLIALLVIGALVAGFVMTDMTISPLRLKMYNWHKWVGVTVLGLAVLRLVWRLTHRPPELLPMPAWQSLVAHTLHGLLYLLLLAQPLAGWIYSNYAGYAIVYLARFPLPTLVEKNRAMAARWEEIHTVFGILLAVLVSLHVLAALKHQFVDRDGTLRRMLP